MSLMLGRWKTAWADYSRGMCHANGEEEFNGHMENGWGVIGKEHVVICMEVKNEPKCSQKKKKKNQE